MQLHNSNSLDHKLAIYDKTLTVHLQADGRIFGCARLADWTAFVDMDSSKACPFSLAWVWVSLKITESLKTTEHITGFGNGITLSSDCKCPALMSSFDRHAGTDRLGDCFILIVYIRIKLCQWRG